MTLLPLLLAPAWFGPATIDQVFPTSGNPFAPTENDVRCVFTARGRRYERLAYFAHGAWHATLAASKGGAYEARFFLNGNPVGTIGRVTLAPAKDGEFVLRDGTRFRTTSGRPFVPFGHNFGWQNGADASYPKQLADMRAAGLNWTRVWSDSWDGKNPYVPQARTTKVEPGWMIEPALDRWSMVVDECEKDAIRLQFVLFHHGLFSTTTDPNWGDHPWNKANGGFLADPTDFFSDPEAKRLTKAWLRYAVARWGHSTAIMAWELFNEVQWVDAIRVHPERVADVVAWHREMGDYVRSIDPYHHLVVSSSNENLPPAVFETMDYEQPHTYPASVFGAVLGAPVPKGRPIFFGELGPGGGGGAGASADKMAIRDAFWGGLLAGHAGPAQYWFWDRVYRSNLYEEFARDARILARSGFAENPDARPAPVEVATGMTSDLTVRPGRGGAAEKTVFDLPRDASAGTLAGMSGRIQAGKEPVRLRFVAREAGVAHVLMGQASRAGGGLRIAVNGGTPITRDWPAAARDTRLREDVEVPFAAGANEIAIGNPGKDWVAIGLITIPGIGTGVTAVGLRNDRYALARLQWAKPFGAGPMGVSIPGLRDGAYELRQFDADKGTEKTSRVRVRGGKIEGYAPVAMDEGLALLRGR